jgi:hypothetical protein
MGAAELWESLVSRIQERGISPETVERELLGLTEVFRYALLQELKGAEAKQRLLALNFPLNAYKKALLDGGRVFNGGLWRLNKLELLLPSGEFSLEVSAFNRTGGLAQEGSLFLKFDPELAHLGFSLPLGIYLKSASWFYGAKQPESYSLKAEVVFSDPTESASNQLSWLSGSKRQRILETTVNFPGREYVFSGTTPFSIKVEAWESSG